MKFARFHVKSAGFHEIHKISCEIRRISKDPIVRNGNAYVFLVFFLNILNQSAAGNLIQLNKKKISLTCTKNSYTPQVLST